MRSWLLSLVLGAAVLGMTALTPATASAQVFYRWGRPYVSSYYGYPTYYYGYPAYYPSYTYSYPSYSWYSSYPYTYSYYPSYPYTYSYYAPGYSYYYYPGYYRYR